MDKLQCNGPGCGRSLRAVDPGEWVKAIARDGRSFLFCSAACALLFKLPRKDTKRMERLS